MGFILFKLSSTKLLVIPELPKKTQNTSLSKKTMANFLSTLMRAVLVWFRKFFYQTKLIYEMQVSNISIFCLLHILSFDFFYVIFQEHILQWTLSLLQKYAIIDVFQKVFTYFKAPINLCNFCVYLKTFFTKFDLILLSS